MKKPTIAYLTSFSIILLASVYPVYMGVQVVSAFVRDGQIDVAAYPKYIIPYTPICLAVILSVAALPLAVRFLKRWSLPVLSIVGTGMFLLSEILFEQVTVFDGSKAGDIASWQAFMCFISPQAIRAATLTTIGQELTARYSPVFKLHFYLIAILIVLAVIGVVHGFYKMHLAGNADRRRPLIIQTAFTAVFVSLCVFACFTAFYRTGEIIISARSSWLMSAFFIVFGVTAGSYAGGLLYGKKPLFSRWIPALTASLTTILMYIGELLLMDGVLFRFGSGFFFDPLGSLPFAPADMGVILLSGIITWLLMGAAGKVTSAGSGYYSPDSLPAGSRSDNKCRS